MMPYPRSGLLGLFAASGLASLMFPEETQAAVYARDGRRLLELLNRAAVGALSKTEPPFVFQQRLPKSVFEAARNDNKAFNTRRFAASMDDIIHYWSSRNTHMTNEEIEDLVESFVTGNARFYVRANKPYAESLAVLGEHSGGRGSLRPSPEYTYLHQVNPLDNKRLLKMRSRVWGTPDGSAVHPTTSHSSKGGATQRAFSADGVPYDANIADTATHGKPQKVLGAGVPASSGNTDPAAAAAPAPGNIQAAAPSAALWWDSPWHDLAQNTFAPYGGLDDPLAGYAVMPSQAPWATQSPVEQGHEIFQDPTLSDPEIISQKIRSAFDAQKADTALAQNPPQANTPDSTPETAPSWWDNAKRPLALGVRNLLEGGGRGASVGLGDPGRVVADWMNLPKPETDFEKNVSALVSGAAEALPMLGGGAGLARWAASPVTRGAGSTLAGSPWESMAAGGLLNLFSRESCPQEP